MLTRLDIRHFAIIDHLDLTLPQGLIVLTGETGAGKSILVEALNLIRGQRASTDLVRSGEKEAIVSAVFHLPEDHPARAQLDELGLSSKEDLLVRRVVSQSGRSRAFINDQAVTLASLSAILGNLVDISGQHQVQTLFDAHTHLLLLDQLGGLESQRQQVTEQYETTKKAVEHRDALKARAQKRLEREDYLRFQLKELEEAKLSVEEEQQLEAERKTLLFAEKIRHGLDAALAELDDSPSLAVRVSRAENQLNRLTEVHEPSAELSQRLQQARLDVEDIVQSLAAQRQGIHDDPQRLEELEERAALIRRLCKKHGGDVTHVLDKTKAMHDELEGIARLDDELALAEEEIRKNLRQLDVLCLELSKKRREQRDELGKKVAKQLAGLGMKKTEFKPRISPLAANDEGLQGEHGRLGPFGADAVEFLIAPNPGEPPKPLRDIASGGELSRVMLAIKAVLLDHDPAETTVFDEVDAGIGGEVAQAVGQTIRRLSKKKQLLCITHLPQIAATADHHVVVSKSTRQGRTFSRVEPLADEQAIARELARMMAGDAGGQGALDAARSLRKKARSM